MQEIQIHLIFTQCYRKSFKYIGDKIWNDVLNNIQNAPSVEAFRYAYKKLNLNSMKGQILFMKYFVLF